MADENAPTNVSEALEEAVLSPRSAESDGQKVQAHSLKELMEADRYLEGKAAAAARRKPFGISRFRGSSPLGGPAS